LEARREAALLSVEFAEANVAAFLEDLRKQAGGELPDIEQRRVVIEEAFGLPDLRDKLSELDTVFESLGVSTEILAENMEAANEELLNVPTGFKIALSRFRAIEGEAMTAPSIGFGDKPQTTLGSELAPDLGARGMTIEVVNIGAIQADDAKTLLNSIKDEAEWEGNVLSGTKKNTQSVMSAALANLPFVP